MAEARHFLEGSDVKVASVVGFPLGAMSSDAKRFETEAAIDDGAQEIDVVLNVGRLRMAKTNMFCANFATWSRPPTNTRSR